MPITTRGRRTVNTSFKNICGWCCSCFGQSTQRYVRYGSYHSVVEYPHPCVGARIKNLLAGWLTKQHCSQPPNWQHARNFFQRLKKKFFSEFFSLTVIGHQQAHTQKLPLYTRFKIYKTLTPPDVSTEATVPIPLVLIRPCPSRETKRSPVGILATQRHWREGVSLLSPLD